MRLHEWKKGSGLTYDQIAALVGTTGTTVYRWATDKAKPNEENIQEIRRVTEGKVTANDFYFCEASESSAPQGG